MGSLSAGSNVQVRWGELFMGIEDYAMLGWFMPGLAMSSCFAVLRGAWFGLPTVRFACNVMGRNADRLKYCGQPGLFG